MISKHEASKKLEGTTARIPSRFVAVELGDPALAE